MSRQLSHCLTVSISLQPQLLIKEVSIPKGEGMRALMSLILMTIIIKREMKMVRRNHALTYTYIPYPIRVFVWAYRSIWEWEGDCCWCNADSKWTDSSTSSITVSSCITNFLDSSLLSLLASLYNICTEQLPTECLLAKLVLKDKDAQTLFTHTLIFCHCRLLFPPSTSSCMLSWHWRWVRTSVKGVFQH